MRSFSRIILVCMTILLLAVSCAQQNAVKFYLAPTGSDTHSGTREKPFQSLEKAKEAVRAQIKEAPGKATGGWSRRA